MVKNLLSWLKFVCVQIFKNKKALLFASFFILLFLAVPFASKAAIGIDDAIMWVISIILNFIMYFLAFLLYIAGVIIDLVLGSALSVQNAQVVQDGWAISRDVVNMFFIIFLLVIAFATIFRIEEYQYKALLPKLILGVLLVNFSRTIATIFIEFSNLLTAAFLNFDPSRTSSSALVALMGVDNIFEVPAKFTTWGAHDMTVLIGMAGIIFILGILTLTLAGFAGLLMIRTVGLLVLIVLSPLAFGFGILPATKKLSDMWWEKFTTYILYTPLCAFALYLAMKTAMQIHDGSFGGTFIGLGNCTPGASGENYCAAARDAAGNAGLPIAFGGNPESFYGFALVIGLLLFTLGLIQEQGGALAGFLIGAAKMGTLGLGAAVGKWGLKGTDRWLARRGKEGGLMHRMGGALGRRLTRMGLAGPNAEKNFSNTFLEAAKGFRLLSFGAHKKAWANREASEDRRSYTESAGYVHSIMNKFLGGSKADHERIAQASAVDEEMGELRKANPAQNHVFLREELRKAIGSKDGNKIEAILRSASIRNNFNEIIRDIGSDPELANELHSGGWLAQNSGRESAFDPAAREDIIKHLLGERRGTLVHIDLGEEGKTRGEMSDSEMYDYANGEYVKRDTDLQGIASAIEHSKMSTDKRVGMHRLHMAAVHHDSGGNEIVDELNPNFEADILVQGFTSEEGKRVGRAMPVDAQKRVTELDDSGKFTDLERRITAPFLRRGETVARSLAQRFTPYMKKADGSQMTETEAEAHMRSKFAAFKTNIIDQVQAQQTGTP